VNTEINLRDSKNRVNFFLTTEKAVSFPRTTLLRGIKF